MSKYNSIIILGPTGTGKTDISIKLAELIGGEIINADSMQIYKYLNIGTAKATAKEQSLIKHHLLDIVEPNSTFSVSEYKSLALEKCRELINNNITPIIVGGTGFYIESLLSNFTYGDIRDDNYRKQLTEIANKNGKQFVYEILMEKDPDTAKKLHYNDINRVIRALEILKVTGKTKSELVLKDQCSSNSKTFLNPLIIGLNGDREKLYERLNLRVDIMVKNGLVDEVKNCKNMGLTLKDQSMAGIGYKELLNYIDGKCDFNTAIENIKLNTRHYAKRQLTWFNHMKNIKWFDIFKKSKDEIVSAIIELYESKQDKTN